MILSFVTSVISFGESLLFSFAPRYHNRATSASIFLLQHQRGIEYDPMLLRQGSPLGDLGLGQEIDERDGPRSHSEGKEGHESEERD